MPFLFQAQEVENPEEIFSGKTWYMTKVILYGEETHFIPEPGLPDVKLNTGELITEEEEKISYVGTVLCESCGSSIRFKSSSQFETFSDGDSMIWICFALDNCDEYYGQSWFETLIEINTKHMQFWDIFASDPVLFDFTITESDGNYTLVVKNEYGNKVYYEEEPILGISEKEEKNLSVYPNPAKNQLYIDNLTEEVQLEIYALSGKKILEEPVSNSSESIDITQLSEGIYFYKLKTKNDSAFQTGKLIKE